MSEVRGDKIILMGGIMFEKNDKAKTTEDTAMKRSWRSSERSILRVTNCCAALRSFESHAPPTSAGSESSLSLDANKRLIIDLRFGIIDDLERIHRKHASESKTL